MNERVEAAAKAAHVSKLTGVQWDDMPKWKRIDRINEARAALAAADAVMFQSLEELAATWDNEWNYCELGDQAAFGKSLAADELRAVIAALKGGRE